MFGKIISINNSEVIIEKKTTEKEVSVLNYHVVFEESNRKIVGEIVAVNGETITILLVGEIKNSIFITGVIKKPNFKTIPRIILKSELELILGNQDLSNNNILNIGNSYIYENFKVTVNINELLSNHFAILGNTGSGKSCGVARLIQNIFDFEKDIPKNSHIVLFDAYGEYNDAFKKFNGHPSLGYKSYTTELEFPEAEIIKIPPYFLEADDLALLLNVTDPYQLPIIEKALKLVIIFTSKDEKVKGYKDSIIASSLLDILSSGRNPVQIRDQIVAILSHYNTEKLNLNSVISQPGYSRTLKQCLNIDNQGKINAVNFVVEYLEQYGNIDPNTIDLDYNIYYTLDDLYYALEFALISEGILKSDSIFDQINILKVRLKDIIDSSYKEYFKYEEFIGRDDYVKKVFTKDDKNAQIINMNFNYIDERFAKVLTKVFAKLFFNYSTKITNRTSFPIHLILEEAHRYVQNDTDINIIGYNIFDRITKEGRKYGVILGFITQRPNELSKTALSQCSNFITFRMFYPEDLNLIASISSNISKESIEKIKTLSPGVAMVFGNAFKIPLIVSMNLPDPMPKSSNVDLIDKWYS